MASVLVLGAAWVDVEGENLMGIEPLISLLIYVQIACLFVNLALWIMRILNTPEPIRQIILIILALILLLWILRTLGIFVF